MAYGSKGKATPSVEVGTSSKSHRNTSGGQQAKKPVRYNEKQSHPGKC